MDQHRAPIRPNPEHDVRWWFPILLALLLAPPATLGAQWSAQPGDVVRNAFGPAHGAGESACRGACGLGCPSSCELEVVWECLDDERVKRVKRYECGTHLGCREHDDCLDRCAQQGGLDCQARCHSAAIQRFGLEQATSWAAGGGPYDDSPITFEYTRDGAGALEPAFRCPAGSRLECSGDGSRCVGAGGDPVDPVFDAYPEAGEDALRISGLRVGPLCGEGVCEHAPEIAVTGEESCDGAAGPAPCTRYGLEFDYRGADPGQPLECTSSTDGGSGDFVGDLIKRGFDSMPQLGAGRGEPGANGLGELLGALQKVVASADSPEDVRVTFTPFGPDGKPVASQQVASGPAAGPPPVPRTVEIPAASGRLLVPLYERAGDATAAGVVEREIRCTHRGAPVLETTVRLRSSR
jgi:hypothetical protein